MAANLILVQERQSKMTVKTYDPACYFLAEHFLQSEPCVDDKDLYAKHADSLAKAIQTAVEDWFVSPDDGCDTSLASTPVRGGHRI